MDQESAAPDSIKYEFSTCGTSSSKDLFGSISGMACTKQGNIVVCDSGENKLVLLREDAQHLRHRTVKGSKPWDVAINAQNIGAVTFPEQSRVTVLHPEFLMLNEDIHVDSSHVYGVSFGRRTNILATSSVIESFRPISFLKTHDPYVNSLHNKSLTTTELNKVIHKLHIEEIDAPKDNRKFQGFFCSDEDEIGHVNYDLKVEEYRNVDDGTTSSILVKESDEKPVYTKIPDLKYPTDVTCDDNGYVYISGQYSDNIIRLTQEAKVVDIPIDRHNIRRPTAMCFNQDFSKFYVANDYGKQVLCFKVKRNAA